MNKTIKAALITGIATIIAGFIGGMSYGKSSEQKNIQNEIQSVMGNVINVTGNDNQVTINSIKDLVDEYQRLQSQNKSLLEQNSKYFSDLSEANYQVSTLQSFTNDMPEINFNNLALSIDAQDIPINKNNSMVVIDGRDYFSREIVESLIPDGQNFTIKDDTLFIGKVIAEKANLSDQNVVNKSQYLAYRNTVKDSYGNTRTNAIMNGYYNSSIIYSLNQRYSYLKCTVSMSEEYYVGHTTTLTIKSDEEIVYSADITKTTEPYNIEVPINNCKLLTIQFDSGLGRNGCIISDAIVYN